MVPKVAGKGTSFKGAGLYYLHDKGASTSERVAFTHTENLPTDDPELALRYMAFTAMRQAELKARSGAARTGRKLAQSVYAYSLSWSPDETPSREDMVQAARETVKLLGLTGHELLFVCHSDEPHPHIHIIANRVNPETGLAAKLAKDHLILSRWAEAYEKEQGEIRCEQRVENNAKRRSGQFVKDRRSLDFRAYRQWQKARLKQAFDRRQIESRNLAAHYQGQRQALHDEKEARIKARLEAIREQNRPMWAEVYRRQRLEREHLDAVKNKAFARLWYWLKTRNMDRWAGPQTQRRGLLSEALRVVAGGGDLAGALARKHEAERLKTGQLAKWQRRGAIRLENTRYRAELDRLRELQRGEESTLRQAHSQESQDLAQEIASGRDRERFQDEYRGMSEEFRRKVGERIKKAKKRDEQSRGKGNERERE